MLMINMFQILLMIAYTGLKSNALGMLKIRIINIQSF